MRRPKNYKSPIVGHYTNEEWERIKNAQESRTIKEKEIQSKRIRELHEARSEKKTVQTNPSRIKRRQTWSMVRKEGPIIS